MANITISSGSPYFSFVVKMIFEDCYKKQTNKKKIALLKPFLLTKTLRDFINSEELFIFGSANRSVHINGIMSYSRNSPR